MADTENKEQDANEKDVPPAIAEAAATIARAFADHCDATGENADTDATPEQRQDAHAQIVSALTASLVDLVTADVCALVTLRPEPKGYGGKQCILGAGDLDAMESLANRLNGIRTEMQKTLLRVVLREKLLNFMADDSESVLYTARRKTPKPDADQGGAG
jgi:hypothetical protein